MIKIFIRSQFEVTLIALVFTKKRVKINRLT